MIDEAYEELYSLQSRHWWYIGARAVYRALLDIGFGKNRNVNRILDVGSGVGGNFQLLEEYGPTVGLEFSLPAIRRTDTIPGLGLICASADHLPFRSGSFDAVTLFGLIEHLENDAETLIEAARVCKPGGIVVLLTSAIPFLWSHHDEANRHARRYYRKELKKLHKIAELDPIRISYQNFFTFFPTAIVRTIQRFGSKDARYDMGGTPSPIINQLLVGLLKIEASLIRLISLPIGVDLVAVSRRRKS